MEISGTTNGTVYIKIIHFPPVPPTVPLAADPKKDSLDSVETRKLAIYAIQDEHKQHRLRWEYLFVLSAVRLGSLFYLRGAPRLARRTIYHPSESSSNTREFNQTKSVFLAPGWIGKSYEFTRENCLVISINIGKSTLDTRQGVI